MDGVERGRQMWLTGPWRKIEMGICDFSCFSFFFCCRATEKCRSASPSLRKYRPLPRVGRKTTGTQTHTRSIWTELFSEKAVGVLVYLFFPPAPITSPARLCVTCSSACIRSANGYVLSSIDGLAGSDAALTACLLVNQLHTHALKHTEKALKKKEIQVSQNS